MNSAEFKMIVNSFRGEVTQEFEQNVATSFGILNMDKATSHGACDALSTYWLAANKSGDNFWTWVRKPSSIIAVRDYMKKFAGSQFDNNIEKAGVVFKPLGLAVKREGTAGFSPFDPQAVAAELIGSDGLKKIGFDGPKGGHAIAAYVRDAETLFFDPNYGEAWFETKMNFAYFFTKFWNSNSFYKNQLGRSGDVVLWA
jgi:hypothetical protein